MSPTPSTVLAETAPSVSLTGAMATPYDLLVIGAGPAGSAASITAARTGARVLMVDKASFPRDKCCGDGLTTLALRQLDELGFDARSVASWCDVDGAWLRSPTGSEVYVALPEGRGRYAAVAPRKEFDAALVDLARDAGVEVVQGHGFSGFVPASPSDVRVHIDGLGEVAARYLVAADGMWSPVRKALGLAEPGYLGEWHAFRQYARNVTGGASEHLYVWFDEDLLPGYAWSFPLPGGRANIGFGVLRDGKRRIQDMKDLWRDLLTRPHIRHALGEGFEMEDRHTAWPIPARINQALTGTGRVLFVGDAVRATDVLTGEGIGQALLTGVEAARAATAPGATNDPAAVRQAYHRAVKHHLVADHRMSQVLGNVLSHRLGARGAIGVLARVSEANRTRFARWMFEDEPRAVIATPSRWHREFLNLSGASVSGKR
jgi:menaquinone-9 beta-reductase